MARDVSKVLGKDNSIKLLYVTHASKEKAVQLAHALLERKLIACYNLFPITSSYNWKGKIVTEDEYVTILKTTSAQVAFAREVVLELHEYQIPCVLELDANANPAYAQWVNGEVK